MRTILVMLTVFVMTTLLGPVVVIARLLRVPQGPTSIYARCVRLWAHMLNRAAGVSSVVVQGGQVPEFQIQPDPAKLIEAGVTIPNILDAS